MTLPFLGDFFLFNATLFAVASAVLYALVWRGKERFRKSARVVFTLTAGLLTAACVTLMTLILTHDFSVNYVSSYSSSDLQLSFLISSFWAGQEGTFLLWLFYLGALGLILYRTARDYEPGTMFYLNLVILSLLMIVLKKSPFELSPEPRLEGAGLNPLLQDYWMVIHPPTMFLGFAAAAIPFVFALTALTQKSFGDWADRARAWTLFAWLAFGVALIEGGFWAYKVLGWGGFWAWDPVENSSFIPWIFLTTQIHTNFIRRRRGGMPRFGLFMVCLSFLSTLYGTFLTRSGVLADFSVHSFVELGINNYLIGGMGFFTLLTVALFSWRWNAIDASASFTTVVSRSYILTLGIVILLLGGVLTLLGTSAPLLTRLTAQPSAVDMSYYMMTMNPIALVILILLSVFPTLKWDTGAQRLWSLWVGLGLAALTASLVTIFSSIDNGLYIGICAFGVSALWANGWLVVARFNEGRFGAQYLAHVGLALLLIGATVSAGHESKTKLALPQGQTVSDMGYEVSYEGTAAYGLDAYHSVRVRDSRSGDEYVARLGSHTQERDGGKMQTPHIQRRFLYDIYMAPLALETHDSVLPGIVTLEKGQSDTLGRYTIQFDAFELKGAKVEGGMPTMAAARLIVTSAGRVDTVMPALEIIGADSLHPISAALPDGGGEVTLASIRTESGAVVLAFSGEIVSQLGAPPRPELIVELTEKPLINFFWFGSLLVFSAGIALLIRRNHPATLVSSSDEIAEAPQESARVGV